MWARNNLTERLNLEWLISQAPMGEYTTPELAAAVSNAGGLGALGYVGIFCRRYQEPYSGIS